MNQETTWRSSARRERGFTLIELLCTATLAAVLAGIALPVQHVMERRSRELELRQNLRTLRRALDSYHFTIQMLPGAKKDATAGNWPDDLEVLVEGVDPGTAKPIKIKFLRRIPIDPLTREAEWGKRSDRQDPDDDLWDSVNVFDVYSLAEGKGLDGTEYKTW
jgi:general secretion pathway protein G